MSSNTEDITKDCFLESLPGSVFCSDNNTIDDNNDSSKDLGTDTNNSDGSIDIDLTDAVSVNDEDYSLEQDDVKGTPKVGFVLSKEDDRNKLVLLHTSEEKGDEKILYIPLNDETTEITDKTQAVIYDKLSDVDENYKYIKLYIPKEVVFKRFPRGTYRLYTFLKTQKKIGKNIIEVINTKFKQTLTIKTNAVFGTEENNKYLNTAFNRNTLGEQRGIDLELEKF